MFFLLLATAAQASHSHYNHFAEWSETPQILVCGQNKPEKSTVIKGLSYWKNLGYSFGDIKISKKCPSDPTDKYGKIIIKAKYFDDSQGETATQGFRSSAKKKNFIYYAEVELNQQEVLYTNENLDTLTHELGHALGIPHVSDRKDIMYTYAQPVR